MCAALAGLVALLAASTADASPQSAVGGGVGGVSVGGGLLWLRTSGGSRGPELAPTGRRTVWRLKRRTAPAP